jgi:ribose transport system ATP-binding protein
MLLTIKDIDKSFFGVQVLRKINFSVEKGVVHGLVGENGAGKTTLMNILGGYIQPDNGFMILCDKPYKPKSPHDALNNGIAFIHQELNLFNNLSVAENLFLTNFPLKKPCFLKTINKNSLIQKSKTILEKLDLNIQPDTPVAKLSAGQRQMIEIAKALIADAKLIIFDEPTTSLTQYEANVLFKIINQLKLSGVSSIYISHNIDDVLKICDSVTVLRDGEVVANGQSSDFDKNSLISHMLGRSLDKFFPPKKNIPKNQILIKVKDLSLPGVISNISFDLYESEILGIAGLLGSGKTELASLLFHGASNLSGQIFFQNNDITNLSPAEKIKLGIAYLTEERRADGLCLDRSIYDNIILSALRNYARTCISFIDYNKLSEDVRCIANKVELKAIKDHSAPVKTLSGGNQQKVVLSKWLLTKPTVLILDEPTRGIDVGAKHEIYALLNKIVEDNAGILFISSDFDELIGICDRIIVLSRGEIAGELSKSDFNNSRIFELASKRHANEKFK